ncbi:hypothetical protein CKM354_000437700 [Cercospora kikuchii]|uniref:Heterokaryon incompatibility domain-containing protein n=1 Tax=Cercospora kikuchii TaxID=84275 RepID=A0A9P3CIH2_9PEZI|nr:uncharacterized protein CKM354_000437700 [Cercospora kikuchii]GIZ41060.1 hypothetical protein CKM354_000437700 [Cercospora kikuchii]
MRLLKVSSVDDAGDKLELVSFMGEDLPPYAILSHTWVDGHEVLFEDVKAGTSGQSTGYEKVKQVARLAAADSYDYVWIDTCCINKSSSAELSEAINSMYKWYQRAAICYAFLLDVVLPRSFHFEDNTPVFKARPRDYWCTLCDSWTFYESRNSMRSNDDARNVVQNCEICEAAVQVEQALSTCRWITRGWTLQELIAPPEVIFYGRGYSRSGTKTSLSPILHVVTRIDGQLLLGRKPLRHVAIAQRLSWASRRATTRPEDMSYSLLGLLGVNMPLLYGEGEDAFIRLQQKIVTDTNDESIFAWISNGPERGGMLANSPSDFYECNRVQLTSESLYTDRPPYALTNQGIEFFTPSLRPWDSCQNWTARISLRALCFLGPTPVSPSLPANLYLACKDVDPTDGSHRQVIIRLAAERLRWLWGNESRTTWSRVPDNPRGLARGSSILPATRGQLRLIVSKSRYSYVHQDSRSHSALSAIGAFGFPLAAALIPTILHRIAQS